jgi:hypothetical protein
MAFPGDFADAGQARHRVQTTSNNSDFFLRQDNLSLDYVFDGEQTLIYGER